jgi:hypothetical protein
MPLCSIGVGTSIAEPPELHAQMASYKTVNGLNDENISLNQKYPFSFLISFKN